MSSPLVPSKSTQPAAPTTTFTGPAEFSSVSSSMDTSSRGSPWSASQTTRILDGVTPGNTGTSSNDGAVPTSTITKFVSTTLTTTAELPHLISTTTMEQSSAEPTSTTSANTPAPSESSGANETQDGEASTVDGVGTTGKTGLAVGIPVAVVIFVLLFALWWFKFRKRPPSRPQAAVDQDQRRKPILRPRSELHPFHITPPRTPEDIEMGPLTPPEPAALRPESIIQYPEPAVQRPESVSEPPRWPLPQTGPSPVGTSNLSHFPGSTSLDARTKKRLSTIAEQDEPDEERSEVSSIHSSRSSNDSGSQKPILPRRKSPAPGAQS